MESRKVSEQPLKVMEYARFNKEEQLETLLEQFNEDPNIEVEGISPLLMAAFCNHPNIVSLLLRHGAQINHRSSTLSNPTALYAAAEKGHLKVVAILLSNGANPNLLTKDHASPLYAAVKKGHIAIVKLLLKNKNARANPNIPSDFLPLREAIQQNNEKMTTLLLEEGAELKVHECDFDALLLSKRLSYSRMTTLLTGYTTIFKKINVHFSNIHYIPQHVHPEPNQIPNACICAEEETALPKKGRIINIPPPRPKENEVSRLIKTDVTIEKIHTIITKPRAKKSKFHLELLGLLNYNRGEKEKEIDERNDHFKKNVLGLL